MSEKRVAIYPGTFDPITLAHIDIIRTASKMFDEVYIAVAQNTSKEPLFSTEERIQFLTEAMKEFPNVKAEQFNGLIVDVAKSKKASVLIRGIRAVADFDYEFQMAIANHKLAPSINTIFIMPSEDLFYISSKLIKEIASFGGSLEQFVPSFIKQPIKDKLLSKSKS